MTKRKKAELSAKLSQQALECSTDLLTMIVEHLSGESFVTSFDVSYNIPKIMARIAKIKDDSIHYDVWNSIVMEVQETQDAAYRFSVFAINHLVDKGIELEKELLEQQEVPETLEEEIERRR